MYKGELTKDFIGVYPNAISDSDCDRIINFYEHLNSTGQTTDRQKHEDISPLKKDNDMAFLSSINRDEFEVFNKSFWNCYKDYSKTYPILSSMPRHQFYPDVKIQKIEPSQGYHEWHCEHDTRWNGSRLLLVIGYLNNVEEGGETEFLYQSRRIPARKGTIMICPSSFTHTHRGNPPLSGTKYIINGWIEFIE